MHASSLKNGAASCAVRVCTRTAARCVAETPAGRPVRHHASPLTKCQAAPSDRRRDAGRRTDRDGVEGIDRSTQQRKRMAWPASDGLIGLLHRLLVASVACSSVVVEWLHRIPSPLIRIESCTIIDRRPIGYPIQVRKNLSSGS
jgi:hypothetical protein